MVPKVRFSDPNTSPGEGSDCPAPPLPLVFYSFLSVWGRGKCFVGVKYSPWSLQMFTGYNTQSTLLSQRVSRLGVNGNIAPLTSRSYKSYFSQTNAECLSVWLFLKKKQETETWGYNCGIITTSVAELLFCHRCVAPRGPCTHFWFRTAENLLPRSCEECECATFVNTVMEVWWHLCGSETFSILLGTGLSFALCVRVCFNFKCWHKNRKTCLYVLQTWFELIFGFSWWYKQ